MATYRTSPEQGVKRRRDSHSSGAPNASISRPRDQRLVHDTNPYDESGKSVGRRDLDWMKRQNVANQAQEDKLMRKWIADEDIFVLKQARKKAAIRVRDGRGKPIDWLTVLLLDLFPEEDLLDEESYPSPPNFDPNSIMLCLSGSALHTLKREIDANTTLERNPKLQVYWQHLGVLCSARMDQASHEAAQQGVRTVAMEVDALLAPKSRKELVALKQTVEDKLRSGGAIDVDYWQELRRNIGVKIAYTGLIELSKAAWLRRAQEIDGAQPSGTAEGSRLHTGTGNEKATHVASRKPDGIICMVEIEGIAGSSSARYRSSSKRPAICQDASSSTTALYEKEIARGLNDDEEIFTGEEPLGNADPDPSNKLRPRKPRYFNRVQMGYEWNKYNQTHYDHDNPPPKVVQGYRFNVFYPDLVDMTKAPTFKIMRENGRRRGQTVAPAGEDDTCIIRFMSGPPYQDIAFRIVDKEWDFSAKRDRGFRSSFDKGILQVYFQFKKVYYRK